MKHESTWRDIQSPEFPTTGFPREIDVAIIGGGITGLTAAYLLKQSGKRVAVFERERIGSGETGKTSAHLTYVTDTLISDLAKQFGERSARLVWQGGAHAIDFIESVVTTHGIDCDFKRVPGFVCAPFFPPDDDDGSAKSADELQQVAEVSTKLGFAARYVANGPVTGRPAVAFADQAVFHPTKYIAGLARLVNGDGSYVFEHAEMSQTVDDPRAVVVNAETIACGDIVIATHVPLAGSKNAVSAALFQTKIYPYSSYVMGGHFDEPIAPGLYSDTADPYYYLRVHDTPAGRYAVFGGEDHKTGQETDTAECFASLERAMRSLLPSVRIDHYWSGQVIESDDGLPFIGERVPHEYAGTGYSGNGLTFGTLAGLMMHDFVLGKDNAWRELFDLHRKPTSPSALGTYANESTDYPFYMIADRLRSAGDDPNDVAPGDGKVLRIDGKRVACHRRDDGTMVKVSAVCTHMGCLVRWNGAEKTWDCPCHGSRFTPDGLVIGGPAETALEKVEG